MKAKKEKIKKYKCFNITKEEIDAILSGMEQIRSDSESAGEEYANWAEKQITLINQFYRKIKIQ